MPPTYDLNSNNPEILRISDVRNLIGKAHVVIEDAEIKSYLRLNNNVIKLAAAAALDRLGTDEAYIQKVIKTLGVETDGNAQAAAFQRHAKALRKEVADEKVEVKQSTAPRGRSIAGRRVDANSIRGDRGSRSEHSPRSRRWY